MSQTYFALLTAVGEAKLANAVALNVPLQISRMAVGDGGGVLPVPLRTQSALIGEQYRADLNSLITDPLNASQIIAELVIPEAIGGWWMREIGLYDAAGDLIAVSNCPQSYKPVVAEGSGKTQVLRMVLVVSSTAAVQLKIDPSVVLATRDFVTTTVADALAKLDGKDSVLYTTYGNINLSGLAVQAGGDWAGPLPAGARVLTKDQATASQNGIYIAAAGAWARSADADTSADVTPGMTVPVEQGTTQADTIWELTTNAPITLGTTALVFELTAALNATQVDAETGTNNTRRMTALRVFQAMRSAAAVATEVMRGVLRVGTQAEVNAGALDDVVVTPKKLRLGFVINMTANGYVVFPTWMGGLIIQWGRTASETSVSFPLAFPTECFQVVAQYDSRSNSTTGMVVRDHSINTISPTGFTRFLGYPWNYIAIGR